MIGIVGSTNVDYVLLVKELPVEGQTIKARGFEKHPGGKGANQAVAAAKLSGESVIFSTLLGRDEDGKWMMERFESLGIIGPRFTDADTGKAFIEVDEEGRNRIVIVAGANALLTPERIDWDLLVRCDVILLQNEIPFSTTLEVARWAKEKGKIVVFDPAPAEGVEKDIFKFVDYLTPNETEALWLSGKFLGGERDESKIAEGLVDLGAKAVILKLGARGVLFKKGLKEVLIEAPKVKAVDTTAAGDVFNGAFAAFLNLGELEALRLAVKAASISVTRRGAQSSIPGREEVIG